MRRTLCELFALTLLASLAQPVRADETVRPPTTAPLPKIPDLPSISPWEVSWKKSDPGVKPDQPGGSADPAKVLPEIPKKLDTPTKKADSADDLPGSGTPPDPKKLKEELENLLRERELLTKPAGDPAADERTKLRNQMDALIKKLDEKGKKPSPPKAADKGHSQAPKLELPAAGKPVDAVRSAANLFKDGDLDAALRILTRIPDLNTLSTEDRVFAQYLTACCQRRTGKVAEATRAFREIAEAKEDPFLAECALWQLSAIRTTQELESGREQLRSRQKGR